MNKLVTDDLAAQDEPSFLRAVVAEPDDDAVRLVYADWLDEHDQPERAEFIRVQCELARKPLTDPQRAPLVRRENEVWRQNGHRWLQSFRPYGVLGGEFRRGFPASVFISFGDFQDHGEDLLRTFPTIQGVSLCERGMDSQRGLLSPNFAQLRAVDLAYCRTIGDRGCIHLATHCPWLGHLHYLGLHQQGFTSVGLESLLSSPHLRANEPPQLHELDLSANVWLRDAGAEVLANAPALRGLKRLNLADCGITDAGVVALAESTNMSEIEEVNLKGNRLSVASIEALICSSKLPRLRYLGLDGTGVPATEIARIADQLESRFIEESDKGWIGSIMRENKVLGKSIGRI